MTLREQLQKGEAQLRAGPHPERAHADAELLLLHLLGKDRAWLLTHPGEEFAEDAAGIFAELLGRRKSGEPIQYITGETEFYGLSFRVTPDVLIPRPETEHLVEKVVELAAGLEQPRIVDVGTGSGAIAVALAHELAHARITAIDLSAPALAVARRNAELNGVSSRIRFLHGDLLAPVAAERFEIVVSNPPYVPAADRPTLSVEVRDHEPALALFAGDDGLDVYQRLIPAAFTALVAGGFVAMEIGFGQSKAIGTLLADSGFEQVRFATDLQGIERVAIAQRL
jgi:release factor glutamine methyltransferase